MSEQAKQATGSASMLEMLGNFKSVKSTSEMAPKKTFHKKIPTRLGVTSYRMFHKVIELPFDPFNMDGDEFNKTNPKTYPVYPEIIVKLLRSVYHNEEDPRYADFIHKIAAKIPDDVIGLRDLDLNKPDIPTDGDVDITQYELSVYNKLSKLRLVVERFRTVKNSKGFSNKVLDLTPCIKNEFGGLEPQELTLLGALGEIEESMAAIRRTRAQETVDTAEEWVDKKDEEKSEYVKNASFRAMQVGFLSEYAILPGYYLEISPDNATKLDDKMLDVNKFETAIGALGYVESRDVVVGLEKELGTATDKDLNFLVYKINYQACKTSGGKDDFLESIRVSKPTISPDYSIDKIFPRLKEFARELVDPEIVMRKKEACANEDEVAKVPQLIDDEWMKLNFRIFVVLKDSYIASNYRQARQAKEFNKMFSMDQLQSLSNAFKVANLDITAVATTDDINSTISSISETKDLMRLESVDDENKDHVDSVKGSIDELDKLDADEINESDILKV